MDQETTAKILVVDDESINIDIICANLEDDNYELVTAGDGESAWQRIENNPRGFDVIILDRMMPGIDGMELLGRIKRDETMEQIPVVMQTAKAEKGDIIAGLKAGAYYYLTKPYDGDLLRTIVRSAVNDRIHNKALHDSVREGRRIFNLMTFGRFRVRDLRDCAQVATQIAHLCPEPHRVVTGISELLINALEHGNLHIGYEEKSRLMRKGTWQLEVERRLRQYAGDGQFVELEFDVSDEQVIISIRDQGDGFDWTRYLEFDPARAFDPHGRGIAVARLSSFDHLEYVGKGNVVIAKVNK